MNVARPQPPPAWTLADRLRKLRRDVMRAEQIPFAQALGATPQAYAAWEAGRTTPRDVVALARRIELVTGVAASWTLGLDETTSAHHGEAADAADVRAGYGINRSCSLNAGHRPALAALPGAA